MTILQMKSETWTPLHWAAILYKTYFEYANLKTSRQWGRGTVLKRPLPDKVEQVQGLTTSKLKELQRSKSRCKIHWLTHLRSRMAVCLQGEEMW